jgi:UDPglucose 6-dehydrogenase
MREAPAITTIEALVGAGATVQAYDPQAVAVARTILRSGVIFAKHSYDAIRGADCLAIVTEWNEFRRPDFDRMRRLMKAPVVFDGRNIFDPQKMEQSGFIYYSIGRDTTTGGNRQHLGSDQTDSVGLGRNAPPYAPANTGEPSIEDAT